MRVAQSGSRAALPGLRPDARPSVAPSPSGARRVINSLDPIDRRRARGSSGDQSERMQLRALPASSSGTPRVRGALSEVHHPHHDTSSELDVYFMELLSVLTEHPQVEPGAQSPPPPRIRAAEDAHQHALGLRGAPGAKASGGSVGHRDLAQHPPCHRAHDQSRGGRHGRPPLLASARDREIVAPAGAVAGAAAESLLHRVWTGYCLPSLPVMFFRPPGTVEAGAMPPCSRPRRTCRRSRSGVVVPAAEVLPLITSSAPGSVIGLLDLVAHDDREAVEPAGVEPVLTEFSPQLVPELSTYGMFVNEMPG